MQQPLVRIEGPGFIFASLFPLKLLRPVLEYKMPFSRMMRLSVLIAHFFSIHSVNEPFTSSSFAWTSPMCTREIGTKVIAPRERYRERKTWLFFAATKVVERGRIRSDMRSTGGCRTHVETMVSAYSLAHVEV